MTSNATGSPEKRVDSDLTHDKSQPAIAMLTNGGWIVTWSSLNQDGSSDGVYQQRFNSAGNALGEETRVNTTTDNIQFNAVVTSLNDGGWVVSWASANQDGELQGIYLQQFDRNGLAVDEETLVNTTTLGSQVGPSIAALAGGGWIVSWESTGQDGSGLGIYQQRYDAFGDVAGFETRVNSINADDQRTSTTSALADGGWVVAWNSDEQDGSNAGIFLQRYDASGAEVGDEVAVNSFTTDDQEAPTVCGIANGGWIVTWESTGQDGDSKGVYQRRYNVDGEPLSRETRVNSFTTGIQSDSSVSALADGGWVVTWTSNGQGGEVNNIYMQRYDADGSVVGTETLVSTGTEGINVNSEVSGLADGSWTVTWRSLAQDPANRGIFQRHFSPDISGSTARKDNLLGTQWDETLRSFDGNDTLNGAGGSDILVGGFGNDTYVVNSAGDQIQEFAVQGTDTALASISRTLEASVEKLVLTGSANINGQGNVFANSLTGNAGKNTLNGLEGNDVLTGGKGIDRLFGGEGTDKFVFSAGDTGKVVTSADKIFDYTRTDGDLIDLHFIDANSAKSGNQAFKFIGQTAFDHRAGEVRFARIDGASVILGDVDGDGKSDLSVKLDRFIVLEATDFLL